jgi:dipeptide transport system permease protein
LFIFIVKRLLLLIPVIIGIVTVTFIVIHLNGHDPCLAYAHGSNPGPAIQKCHEFLGTNLPLWQQYFRYLAAFFTGNWGSDAQNIPVLPQIEAALPATLELVFASLIMMVIIGIPLGVVAARHAGRWPDHSVRIFYLSGWATPTFLAGFLLLVFVAIPLGFPTTGQISPALDTFPHPTGFLLLDALLAGNFPAAYDVLAHLFLPALALAFVNLGIATRMTRSSMLEVLPMDYVKTARMKGLPENRVIYRHALRNSLITTVTVLGLTAGALLAGTVVIESIFGWPGIGYYAYESIQLTNYAGVIGCTVVFAIGVVIANLIADITYGFLDPRVEWR